MPVTRKYSLKSTQKSGESSRVKEKGENPGKDLRRKPSPPSSSIVKERAESRISSALEGFLEWSHDSFLALDHGWRILYANRRWGELLQRNPGSLIGKNFWEEFPKYQGTEVELRYRQVMKERAPVRFESFGYYSDTWYEITVFPTEEGISIFATDRTGEKKALEELKQSEERLELQNEELETERRRWQGIVEGIAEEVWVCDLTGNMSLLNLGEVTPMGLSEFRGKAIEEVLQDVEILEPNGKPRPVELSPLLRSLKGEIIRGDEIMRHRKTGKVRYRRYSSGPMHDESGNIIGSVSIVRDVTDAKQAEIDLQKAHQQTIDILESIGDAFYHIDREWNFTYINKEAEVLWRKPREEILGKRIWDIFPQAVGSETYQAHLQALLENRPIYLETMSAIINRWIMLSISPADGGLSVYFRDIDAQKKAQQALQRNESVLTQAGEMAHLGAWDIEFIKPVIDNDNPLHWSDEVYRIFGYKPGSVKVSNDLFFQHVHPDDRPLIANSLREAVENRSFYSIEHRIIRADGVERLVAEHAQISFDALGKPRWIIGAVQDVTEQRQVQIELKQYSERLERSNLELQDFAYVASHDLQEPLRKVSIFGDSLYQEIQPRLTPEECDLFDRMLKAIGRMQAMINDLLDLSRVTTQGKPFREVNLNKVIKDALVDLELSIKKTQGQVFVGNLPKIKGDPGQIERLFLNLIGNALKYHQEKAAPVVRISGKKIMLGGLEMVEIRVEDHGIGFDMRYAEQIFQPFHRLHGRNKYEGTGMGLAICRQIVLRHGGTISARSIPGKGSTFLITLPLF